MAEIEAIYPYLCVRDAAGALEFYTRAFGGVELFRLTEPGGRIGHAEMRIGAATIMLSDEYPEYGRLGPGTDRTTSMILHIHCADVDALFERAVSAGATVVRPIANQFYGERTGTVRDPYGHQWLLGAQIEAVTPEEMQRRFTALFNG